MLITRTWYDTDERSNVVQVGVLALVDGERRAECFSPVGPFDSVEDILSTLHGYVLDALERQIEGQQRLC